MEKELPTYPSVSVFKIVGIASFWAKVFGYAAILCGIVEAAMFPFLTLILGQIFEVYFSPELDEIQDKTRVYTFYMVGVGVGSFLFGFFRINGLNQLSESIAKNMRKKYYDALLSQEVSYYDGEDTGRLVGHLGADVATVQQAMGKDLGDLILSLFSTIVSFSISFYRSWKMTLILVAVAPIMAISGCLVGDSVASVTSQGLSAFANASQKATETLSEVRTVKAFGMVKRSKADFDKEVDVVRKLGTKRARALALGSASSSLIVFASYAAAFYYGGVLVSSGEASAADVVVVLLAVLTAAGDLADLPSDIPQVLSAGGAAAPIFFLLKTSRPETGGGTQLDVVRGAIEFEDVSFVYPQRPDKTVLDGFSLRAGAAETTALVGPSGSGKSTTIQLLLRFYDPLNGSVKIDGRPLRQYDLEWLREQMAVVSQEPALFSGTITDNVMIGDPKASKADVESALRKANAWDFIKTFPKGLDTEVGEGGAQLSGGQKQRIAIARAVLKNPKILLLDEATSALDTESEGIVQEALERLMTGRTTIVIAHRLSTIRDADRIVVVEAGRVIESGKHADLIERNGAYTRLVLKQSLAQSNTETKPHLPNSPTPATRPEGGSVDDGPSAFRSKRTSRVMSVNTGGSSTPPSRSPNASGGLIAGSDTQLATPIGAPTVPSPPTPDASAEAELSLGVPPPVFRTTRGNGRRGSVNRDQKRPPT